MTIHFGDGTTLETAPEGGGGQLVGVKGVRNSSTLTSTSTGYQIPSGQTTTFTVPEAGNYILFHSFNYTFQRSSNQTNTNYQGRVMKNGSQHYFWINRVETSQNNLNVSSDFKTIVNSSYLQNLSANDTIEVRVEYRSNGGGTNTRTRLLSGGYMVNGLMKLS